MKNFIVGLLAMIGLATAGLVLYGVGSLIVGLIGIVVAVVVAATLTCPPNFRYTTIVIRK